MLFRNFRGLCCTRMIMCVAVGMCQCYVCYCCLGMVNIVDRFGLIVLNFIDTIKQQK